MNHALTIVRKYLVPRLSAPIFNIRSTIITTAQTIISTPDTTSSDPATSVRVCVSLILFSLGAGLYSTSRPIMRAPAMIGSSPSIWMYRNNYIHNCFVIIALTAAPTRRTISMTP